MATYTHKQRGAVLPLIVIGMLVLIMAAGLAFSAGLSYMIKAKLNAATDSAALAGARATSLGGDQATQTANAKAAAARFFNANFPAGYLGSTATLGDTQVSYSGGQVTVSVSASATMPASLLGGNLSGPLTPGVLTQTTRKDLDMVITLDTSGSLSDSAANVRSSAITFLKQFNSTQDRVGLVHFAYGSEVDDAIRPTLRGFDRTSMETHIKALKFEGSTASPEGMWRARAQLNSVPSANLNRSNLRVIIFFSDGAPNSFAAYLNWKNSTDCTVAGTIATDDDGSGEPSGLYSPDDNNTALAGKCNPYNLGYNESLDRRAQLSDRVTSLPDWYNGHDVTAREFKVVTTTPRVVTNAITYQNVNRAARNLVEAMAAKSQDEGIYVFTLGLGSQLKAASGADKEKGEDTLKCMANAVDAPARCARPSKPVGVYCYAATQADLTPCFSKLASAILKITK
ncbi:VWA domain-containing protein [Duganella sp. BuS-21]|uniref:VWA domain-containing protein n=1 Tax=Duganella sp. BuS-21 TaxID=2943848 RepID=UPI0035A6E918